jgi:protoheme IX farnesyltransferase
MLPTVDGDGTATARQMLIYTVALIVVTLVPVFVGDSSGMYGFGALGLGMFFLRFVWMFGAQPADAAARKVLQASLIYLPSVMGLLLLERWIRYMMG